ncbi:MAG: TPM domain-containing protein [Candidatus Omnitrophica bacterium]|nr:TPM domain-containing protein [Candidatus Omnitrophota bacterium]
MIRKASELFVFYITFLVILLNPSTRLPKPSSFINDFAGILTIDEKSELEKLVRDFEKSTGIEIAVVMLGSLEGRSVEDVSNEIFSSWGIGKKDKDNGVLILISMNEKKIRIEVGYGLEASLTDGRCGYIIRNRIAPAFKEGRYFDGLKAGINGIEDVVAGKSQDVDSASKFSPNSGSIAFLIVWQLFCLFYASRVAGLLGFVIIAIELAVLDYMIASASIKGYLWMLALHIPFLTCFFLFFLFFILNITGIMKTTKTSSKKWFRGFHSGSYGAGGGFSGGGFGGGSSGGGGATGGW